jgi:hypothetical protein
MSNDRLCSNNHAKTRAVVQLWVEARFERLKAAL